MFKEIVDILEADKHKVKIVFEKRKMCDCCRMSSLCNKGQEALFIENSGFDLKPGDKVEIAIDERKTILANLLTFLIPAFIFVGILFIFRALKEQISFLLAIFSLCLYYIFLKIAMRKNHKDFEIKILKKINQDNGRKII